MLEHIFIAVIIAVLVWWLLANLIGPLLVRTGAPFLTELGNAFVKGAILLGFVAGALWFLGGPKLF